MFTGLIIDIGTVISIENNDEKMYRRVIISSRCISTKVRKGDSVAVNGVCLTVVQYSFFRRTFTVEVLYTSLEKTNLSLLQKNDNVNLELSLKVGDSLGGHFVLGHVETIGRIVNIYQQKEGETAQAIKTKQHGQHIHTLEKNYFYTIKMQHSVMRYMCPEGSVSLDGISLTIAYQDKTENTITVNIIPHTYYHTTLQYRKKGDSINIEPDILLKHTSNMLSTYTKE